LGQAKGIVAREFFVDPESVDVRDNSTKIFI
jgi:hypothetical protein